MDSWNAGFVLGGEVNQSLEFRRMRGPLEHANFLVFGRIELNVSKTKEPMVDFRTGKEGEQAPVYVGRPAVERVSSFKSLGINISDDLSWAQHVDAVTRKARQRLYFLRRLWRFSLSPNILTSFYRCTAESLLTGRIRVWDGDSNAQDRKKLQRVADSAQYITGTSLPTIGSIYRRCCLKKATFIIKDPRHPGRAVFSQLPSGRRYRSLKTPHHQVQEQRLPFNHSALELTGTTLISRV
ncbi:uncharacterized protein LOC127587523 [Pristis pectinata]|uniref:uncharacterized protein LOC127587523 n=1 Tax=Pristis pectinata TaxID=685728 RepID=UPI00223DA032|nr:uncharacterized protein LOC127587523 [Pristis pectinata]